MKKEGSWISAFKRIFICSSEPKNINGSRKRSKKERGVKIRKQRCDDRSPFVTLFSGTSSIEKILEDVEKEQQLNIQATSCTREQETPTSASAPVPLQPHDQSGSPPQMSSICSLSPHPEGHRLSIKSEISGVSLSIITDRDHAALIIQTTYRGYMARRSLRALKGLVRLQGVVRGQNVKRQTSAMKYMQLLFRAHFQVGSWRGEMMERLRVQRQQIIPQIQIEGDDQQRAWDDSLLLKGETEARLQRKGDAFISRQRVLSYSYSHKVLNLFMAPSSGTASSSDVKRAGFQWWWNRLESRVPRGRMPAVKISPRLSWPGDGQVATTPLLGMMRSMRAAAPLNRQAQTYTPARSSYCSNPRTSTWNEDKEEEEESFTSCPNFSSSPNYMTPTISAMAKARPTHSSVARQGRRLSYPLTPVVPSSKWNTALRSSISSSKESEPRRALGGRYSPLCLADEGTFSSPTSVVRIPFNRFV